MHEKSHKHKYQNVVFFILFYWILINNGELNILNLEYGFKNKTEKRHFTNFTCKITFLIKSSCTSIHEKSDAQLSSNVAKTEACLEATSAFQP